MSESQHIYRIAAVLAEHHLDNKELAELIGVTPTTVSRWCNHVVQPSEENLYKIAKVLKINPKDLIVSITWPEGKSEATLFKESKSKKK